jgi:hypothetical protein
MAKEGSDSSACFNQGTLLFLVERRLDEATKYLGWACDKGFASGCIEKAVLLYPLDAAGASGLASGQLAGAKEFCEKQPDETCMIVADWLRLTKDATGEKRYRRMGNEQLAKNCREGDKASCRLKKIWRNLVVEGSRTTGRNRE